MRSLSRLRTIRSDERGASLALVALSLVWILGMASLVVDVGGGWLTRQTLIPATDAAALAAAQDLVDQPWDTQGACVTAGGYVTGNAPAAAMIGCEITPFAGGGGRVTVTASEGLDTTFVDLGEESRSVESVSSAAWGPPATASGLRPLAFCYDGSTDLRQLIDNPPSSPTWVNVDFAKDDPAACGVGPYVGNFATLDFEGGTGIHEIRDWMRDGYPGQVGFEGPTTTDCGGGVTCYERPYALLDLTWQLSALRNSGRYASFPIFDYANDDELHVVGLLRARLYAFDLGGSPQDWSVELKVEPGLITGTCCGPPGVLSGNQVIAICGVDPGAYLACSPSPGP